MKSSLSRILFNCIVLFCFQLIISAKDINVQFFEHAEFKGAQYTVTVKEDQCHNLNAFDNKASSINSGGACVYVYDDFNCRGDWRQISPMTSNHNKLEKVWDKNHFSGIDFNDKISSVQFCSNVPVSALPAMWTPTYFFDRAHECYPGYPDSNGGCPSFKSTAPLYYDVKQCNKDGNEIYRIQYWLFYGGQRVCSDLDIGKWSQHDNDWEHVTYNFRRCEGGLCLSSITYSQHGGWYTRKFEGLAAIYVGKIGHGNYYDSCCSSGCESNYCSRATQCFAFNDFRNPNRDSIGRFLGWKPFNVKHCDQINEDRTTNSSPDIEKVFATIKTKWERDTCGNTMFKTCKDQCRDNNSDF